MKRVITTMVVVTTLFFACKKDKPKTEPSVSTSALTNVTSSSATAGGTITSNGNDAIMSSGIVWSKMNNTPTLTDSVLTATATAGSFSVNLAGLDFNTSYYIRAYATNSVGTAYGNVVTLNTTNDTSKVRFTYMAQSVIYGVITSSVTGKKWMDRNLGASRAGLNSVDSLAYGDLFQWGRLIDGHQLRTSDTTKTLSSSDIPGHSKFIVPSATPRDWRNPQNNNLWQGSTGINNPCPAGWHVPTKAEWDAETGMTDTTSAFSRLKLVLAGFRSRLSGSVTSYGASGQYAYWSSIPEAANSYEWIGFTFGTGSVSRGQGCSVRCIKD